MIKSNAELAALILSMIEKCSTTHDQGDWMAGATFLAADEEIGRGTTLCVAGYAAHFAGYTLERAAGGVRAIKNGCTHYVDDVARTELHLTDDDAADLFHSGLDHDEVLAALGQLADGEKINWGSL